MKLSTIVFFGLSSQANAKLLRNLHQCPVAGTGVSCPTVIIPVACGDGYKCEYDNACLANAAGFVNCLPVEELCPKPGTGITCPLDKKEVICNGKCTYDNHCLANAAGFATGQCFEVPTPCNPTTGANCPPTTSPPPVTNPPLPPCTPTTTGNCMPVPSPMSNQNTASASARISPPIEDFCPTPGTGIMCPLNIDPVGCGDGYRCVYDNACLANAAGFVGCLPVEDKCPLPGAGIICPMNILPVMCNRECQYDNACLANAAGYADNACVEIPTPSHPIEEETCPLPGAGIACPMNVQPVLCDHKCKYDNACLANAAGYAANVCFEMNPSATPCNPTTSGDCNRKYLRA